MTRRSIPIRAAQSMAPCFLSVPHVPSMDCPMSSGTVPSREPTWEELLGRR